MQRYVIVGSGAAGIAAAEAIRSVDRYGEILMVSEDPFGYYSRPGLAYYLSGEIPERSLFPFSATDYSQLKLKLHSGRVMGINRVAHEIVLADNTRLPYDRALLATGSYAAQVSVPGADLEGVVKLDNLQDAQHILKLARRAQRAVVVGGGITALEIVEGLASRRVKIDYFLRGDRYWSNVLDETESRIVEQRLKDGGVQICYQTELAEIAGRQGQVCGAITTDGRYIQCQIIAIAIGVKPRIELAEAAGLHVERGVLVNQFLQTNDTDIFAAGDIAQTYDPFTGKSVMDTLWGPARDQGRIAGLNMAGRSITYCKEMAFNVTRLAGLTTTIIGTVGRGQESDLVGIARGESELWRQLPDAITAQSDFEVNRLRMMVGQQALLGTIVMGDQTLSPALQQMVKASANISPIRERLLQANAPLGEIIAEYWTKWRQSHASYAAA
jgi:nitrite reductase (NADH) large subunit